MQFEQILPNSLIFPRGQGSRHKARLPGIIKPLGSLIQNGRNLRIIDIGLVIPIEAGVDEFRELLALERLDCILDSLVADANGVLRIAPAISATRTAEICWAPES